MYIVQFQLCECFAIVIICLLLFKHRLDVTIICLLLLNTNKDQKVTGEIQPFDFMANVLIT